MNAPQASLRQFGKFVVTGGLNTLVDFAVLNLLIFSFSFSHSDPRYIYFKAISYAVASCNSFVLNKLWVFERSGAAGIHQISSFIGTSLIGLLLNAAVSAISFHFLSAVVPAAGVSILANMGALCGTITVLFMNFFAYKFVVFRK